MNNTTELILRLKEKEDATILAHFYQTMDIQNVADIVGDSLKLSLEAMKLKSNLIIFCGVYFMAEQAAVLNPSIPVLIPDKDAICPLANMLSIDDIVHARKKYPNSPLVLYVNSKAIHKAYADYIVTSANAVDTINEIPNDTIIFGPDKNLAEHVAEKTGKKIIPIPPHGHCPVHVKFTNTDVTAFKNKEYSIIVHPECNASIRRTSDFVGSTGQMYRYIQKTDKKRIAIGTEVGFVDKTKKDLPSILIEPLRKDAICENMKKITLQKLLLSLKQKVYRVYIDPQIAKRVRSALDRTFKLLGII
ncbi:MAG: quinolinate synthase NadA, partial [Candidatus Njordarchaeota archaeon]